MIYPFFTFFIFCIATLLLNKKTFYIIKNEIETDI